MARVKLAPLESEAGDTRLITTELEWSVEINFFYLLIHNHLCIELAYISQ